MKRIARSVVVFLAPISLLASPQRIQRDAQATTVIQQALSVSGGAALQGISDTVVQGTVTYSQDANAKPAPVILKTKGADRLRWESVAGGATIINSGKALYRKNGAWKTSSNSSFIKRADHLPLLLVLYEFLRADAGIKYKGLANIDGRDAHELVLSRVSTGKGAFDYRFQEDSEIRILIDSRNFEVVKLAFAYPSSVDPRRKVPMEISYGDYQTVSGVRIPLLQQVYVAGNKIMELRISSFSANVGLADTEFEGR